LQHFRIHDHDLLIKTLCNLDEKLYIVSDGGMKDGKGSFGVAVGTPLSELISIEVPVSGYSEHSNSFRRKAYGMMAGFRFLSLITQVYKIQLVTPRKMHAYCDNLSLASWVQKIILHLTHTRMFLLSGSDVVLQISQDLAQLQKVNCHIILDHVKRHQDAIVQYEDFLREAKLNVAADHYATNLLRAGTFPSYEELPANAASLYINNNIITRDLKTEVRKAARSPDLRVYMIKRFGWKDSTPNKVWWSVHGSAIN
jgi:hypothetical protein